MEARSVADLDGFLQFFLHGRRYITWKCTCILHVLGERSKNHPICFLAIWIFLSGEKFIKTISRRCIFHIVFGYWLNSVGKEERQLSGWRSCTTPKIRNKYSQKWNCAAALLICAFIYLWAIYIFPRWVRLFCFNAFADRTWEYMYIVHIYSAHK